MQIVSITVDAYKEILEHLEKINKRFDNISKPLTLAESWIDVSDTCIALNISKRTCQNYRDQGILPFSQIGGKIYFKVADIEDHLKRHYVNNAKK